MTTRTSRPISGSAEAGPASTDIVDRLRQYNPPDRTIDAQRQMSMDIHEAADTITALRVVMLEECAKRGHLMAEVHELRSRVAELERDAARYRWLRGKDFCIAANITSANADAAIDAAIKG